MKEKESIIAAPILTIDFFKKNLWTELNRWEETTLGGYKLVQTVTCTEENFENLYKSQLQNNRKYFPHEYRYTIYEQEKAK